MWSCKTSRIPAAESEELSFEVSALKISALNLNLGGSIHAVNWQARVPSWTLQPVRVGLEQPLLPAW